ncbi:MAG: GNAT family N-acetyltransferase [Desulfobacterales bacterium]|jgi:CelD/BcsL family acetyltransferase involved in cellulose biosynthesis
MTSNDSYTVTQESTDSISDLWHDSANRLKWDCLFVLPGWLKVWWQAFGGDRTPYLCSIRSHGELIGMAPLMVEGQTARLMGDTNVCDFQDVVVLPGREKAFFDTLFDHLKKQGVRQLDLEAVRANSTLYRHLVSEAADQPYAVDCQSVDATMVLDLPSSWDAYLRQLTGKQRHEVRRKFRRLEEAGRVALRAIDDVTAVNSEMDTFLTLFKKNRTDKARFMTDQMASFFHALAVELASARILRLFYLTLDDAIAAAVICFDYAEAFHLYNNGYDESYHYLSVGLLSKLLTIKKSIQLGRKTYDFLKGTEVYKHRLGGKQIPLYRCRVSLI